MTGISGKPNYALREARARGDKFYIPDFECKNGHMTKRFTGSGACYECCQALNAANTKKYRNGPDGDAFRAKKAAELARWLAKPENASKREIYAQRDLEKFGKRQKKAINGRVDTSNQRAKRLGIEGRITCEEISGLLIQQDHRCKSCDQKLQPNWNIDHIMPLRLRGFNKIENIQILCRFCNRSKGSMHPEDWERIRKLERQGLAFHPNPAMNGVGTGREPDI